MMPRGAFRGGARLGAAACGIAVFVAVVVLRSGTEKLVPARDVLLQQSAHGTWRHMFVLDGVAARIPLPLWLAALVGAGVIGLPYAWICGQALPDRGYGLSKVVGLLLVTWLAWWVSSLRLLPFSQGSIVLTILVVAGGAALITLRHGSAMAAWVRANWRVVLICEGVFWVLFGATLFVRWSNPDLWHASRGGEKPMDFAYLNAVAKSTSFPPYDPWFAGGQMNYYYLGFVQVASLAKLTGVAPVVAYNLAIPTLAGLLGAAVFSATLGLAPSSVLRGRFRIAVAVLAGLFVTVLGNLGEIRVLRSTIDGAISPDWWFWNASRVIRPGADEPGPITEFPAFTFIFGDLHAHAMALPVAATALALTVAVVRAVGKGLEEQIPCLALLGLVLGTLWVTNSWDLPTYALLAACGVALATIAVERSFTSLLRFVCACAAMVAVAYAAFLPFHLHDYAVFEGVARWHGGRTRLFDYLTIHGLFLFAIATGFAVQVATSTDLGSAARTVRATLRHPRRIGRLRELDHALVTRSVSAWIGLAAVPCALAIAVGCAVAAQWPAAVALPVALLGLLSWPVQARAGMSAVDVAVRRLLVIAVLLALSLTVAVEYYVARNIDVGRVNTVFKLYLQVWLLLGVAAAVCVGVVYQRLPRLRRPVRATWRLVLVALVATAALYPILGARAKISDRFDTSVGRTLDGSAFMKKAIFRDKETDMTLAYDRDAIRWMLDNLDGSPVIAELNTAPTLYGWEGRYSVYTGNPTIVGWDYHQRQQRPPMRARVQQRVRDVQLAYRTPDPAVAFRILSYYGARYAVVGPLERAYYPSGSAKWEEGAGRYWTRVYANPGVQIYRIRPSAAASIRSAGSSYTTVEPERKTGFPSLANFCSRPRG